jgi:Cys-tRNA(Pro)/Cys-tRNA(Cys) deacylase
MAPGKVANTRAILELRAKGVEFEARTYRYAGPGQVALDAAEGIGAAPEEVFKTLVFQCNDEPVVVVVDALHTVSVKKLAAACGPGTNAAPCQPRDAERITGYQVGGISPLGQKRPLRTFLDDHALGLEKIWINGGCHGLLIRVGVEDLIRLTDARVLDLVRE